MPHPLGFMRAVSGLFIDASPSQAVTQATQGPTAASFSTFLSQTLHPGEALPGWMHQRLLGIVSAYECVLLGMVFALGWAGYRLLWHLLNRYGRLILARLGVDGLREALARVDRALSVALVAGALEVVLPKLGLAQPAGDFVVLWVDILGAVAGVVVGVRLVDVLAAWLARRAAQTETSLDDHLVPLLHKSLRLLVAGLGLVWVLHQMHLDIGGLVAGLGLGGLAFALAAKDTLANLLGSATIFADRPFAIGDWVTVGDTEGVVEYVGFRSTRIRTFYNSLVAVPNAKITDSVIDNYGARHFRRCRQTLQITYDTPPHSIEAFVEGIRDILRAHPNVRNDVFEVHLNAFGSSSLDIMLYFFFRVDAWSDELAGRQDVFLEIIRLAEKMKVEFAFPTQTLRVASGGKNAALA